MKISRSGVVCRNQSCRSLLVGARGSLDPTENRRLVMNIALPRRNVTSRFMLKRTKSRLGRYLYTYVYSSVNCSHWNTGSLVFVCQPQMAALCVLCLSDLAREIGSLSRAVWLSQLLGYSDHKNLHALTCCRAHCQSPTTQIPGTDSGCSPGLPCSSPGIPYRKRSSRRDLHEELGVQCSFCF